MRLDIFRMFYTNIGIFFLAAEFKNVLLSVGTTSPLPFVN